MTIPITIRIIHHDPRGRRRSRPPSNRKGGRLHVGTAAGFRSETPAGFIGIRSLTELRTGLGEPPPKSADRIFVGTV